MLPFLRGSNPPRRDTASHAKIYYEDGRSWQEFSPPGSAYFVRQSIPPGGSMFNPPPHLHLFQTERFRCVAGTGLWRQPTHPDPSQREVVLRAGDPPLTLPAGLFHRFENAANAAATNKEEEEGDEKQDQDLVVDIGLDPESQNAEAEHRFFRNFFGYLEDCRTQGGGGAGAGAGQPSLFQLELFLCTVDTPLAVPVPGPNWLKAWVSRVVMVVLGRCIGQYLLGYRASYPEYYSGPMEKKHVD